MREKEGKERVRDSFEDKRNVLVLGGLAWVYFIFHFSKNVEMVHLVPVMKPWVYMALAGGALTAQVCAWFFFGHFRGQWYKSPLVSLLFLCEFGMIFFMLGFMAWPFYAVFQNKLT